MEARKVQIYIAAKLHLDQGLTGATGRADRLDSMDVADRLFDRARQGSLDRLR